MKRRFLVHYAGVLGCFACGAKDANPADGLAPNLALVAWRTPINETAGAIGWGGTPAVADGRVVIAEGANISAFESLSGRRVWTTQVRDRNVPVTSGIAIRGAKLFFPDVPSVYSLDAASGRILWKFTPKDQANVAQCIVDDRALYIGTRGHEVYALDISDGHPLWNYDVGKDWDNLGIVQGITESEDTLYVAVSRQLVHNGYLRAAVIVALKRTTGSELWRYQSEGDHHDIVASPVVAGRFLIGGDQVYNSFFAVDRFTGKEVWRVEGEPGGFGPQNSAYVVGDTAFISSNDRNIYAVDVPTGRIFWRARSGGSFSAGIACGRYVIGNSLGLEIFDRASGKKVADLFRHEYPDLSFPTSHFAQDGKRAYVSGTGALYAVKCDE